MEQTLYNLLPFITWPSALFGIVLLLYKSGIFGVISKKLANGKSSPESDSRIKDLEDFKVEAETNHFHQINNLEKSFIEFRLDMEKRLTKIETHLFNGKQ